MESTDWQIFTYVLGQTNRAKAFRQWKADQGIVERRPDSIAPTQNTLLVAAHQKQLFKDFLSYMALAGATQAEIDSVDFWKSVNDIAGPGGTAEDLLMALSPVAARTAVRHGQAAAKADRAFAERLEAARPSISKVGPVVAGVQLGPAHNAANAAPLAEDLSAAELANPVMENLRNAGALPSHYVTKSQATAAGWTPGKALGNSVPGGQHGGDVFRDPSSIGLPTAPGRVWYEADIGLSSAMSRAKQPGTRLLYSGDGKRWFQNVADAASVGWNPGHFRMLAASATGFETGSRHS